MNEFNPHILDLQQRVARLEALYEELKKEETTEYQRVAPNAKDYPVDMDG
jgi:hypothetical protein